MGVFGIMLAEIPIIPYVLLFPLPTRYKIKFFKQHIIDLKRGARENHEF